MKLRAPLLFIVPALLLGAVALAHAQSDTGDQAVLGVGTSKVQAADMTAGREAALQAALNMAVARALTDLVSPETMAGQFQEINQTILSHPDQFVRDYKVLTDATAGDTYRVVVQATVLVGRLKESLKRSGVRLGRAAYPRVLVCVAERRGGAVAPVYWWRGRTEVIENISQTVVSQALSEAGFPLAETSAVAAGTYPPELNTAEAAALGSQFQAEVVVTGMAAVDAIESTPGGAAGPFKATVRVQALRVADGQIIAQKEVTIDGPGGEAELLRAAAAQAGQGLATQMAEAWFKQASAGSRLEVAVKGVGGKIANFVKFRGVLSGLSGVDNVLLKTMMPDQAILTLNYQGTSRSLADAILSHAFEGFSVTVDGVSPETIQVTIVPH